MRSIVSSPRRRRRLLWWSGALAVVVVLTAVSAALWNTGGKLKIDHSVPTGPILTEAAPKQVPFTGATQRQVNSVLQQFVATAVTGQNLPASYDLVTPFMREGMSRNEWSKGNIPVERYPAKDLQIGRIINSTKDDVVLEAALEPRRGVRADLLDVQVELKAVGAGSSRRWLVDSFATTGVIPSSNPAPVTTTPTATAATAAPKQATRPTNKGRLSGKWLLLPAAILGLILLIPIGLGIAAWYRRRQAYRRWASG